MYETYPDLMTIKDLQEALQIGRSKSYELVNTGAVRGMRIGNSIRIPKANVIDYVVSQCYNKRTADGCPNPLLEVVQ